MSLSSHPTSDEATGSQGGTVLEPLGINDLEEQIYGIVLDRPGSTPAELLRASGATRRQLVAALDALEARGLVSRSAERPRGFLPASPDLAIEVLLLRRQEDLERVRMMTPQFLERFRRGGAFESTDLVEVIRGRAGVVQRFQQLQQSATAELLGFDTPPYASVREESDDVELQLLKRGVSIRSIYDRSVFEMPGVFEAIAVVVAAGEDARATTGLPTKLIICDRRVALIPLDVRRPIVDSAIVVRQSGLLDALVALFERIWDTATPLDVDRATRRQGSDRQDLDQRILALLAVGLTELAIAGQLRVSARTVSRRVEGMMASLRVQTRFQLGMAAAERGGLRAGDADVGTVPETRPSPTPQR